MANRKPRRGNPGGGNVLVTGDTGTTAGPQGGARPGPHESGNLAAREYGVPQADLPGGIPHVVNPESRPAATQGKQLKPADYRKYHGVPPIDNGQYETPSPHVTRGPAPVPVPHRDEAVPVYVVQEPGRHKVIRTLTTIGPLTIPANDTLPRKVCDRDLDRVTLFIMNENGTRANELRVGSYEDTLQQAGYFIGGASGTGFEIKNCQDEVWIWNPNTSSITWSALLITEIPVSGP